jgi:hypothetical protein
MKPKHQAHTGICQRIQAAKSVEEVSALLTELDSYKLASPKTVNRAKRLAAKQTRQLTHGR